MEEIQKNLQLYREQIKSYSDFVIGLTKDYNMLFDEVKELRQAVDELKGVKRPVYAVMVPMFSKKGGHK
jgi:prefoldin subunit 5